MSKSEKNNLVTLSRRQNNLLIELALLLSLLMFTGLFLFALMGLFTFFAALIPIGLPILLVAIPLVLLSMGFSVYYLKISRPKSIFAEINHQKYKDICVKLALGSTDTVTLDEEKNIVFLQKHVAKHLEIMVEALTQFFTSAQGMKGAFRLRASISGEKEINADFVHSDLIRLFHALNQHYHVETNTLKCTIVEKVPFNPRDERILDDLTRFKFNPAEEGLEALQSHPGAFSLTHVLIRDAVRFAVHTTLSILVLRGKKKDEVNSEMVVRQQLLTDSTPVVNRCFAEWVRTQSQAASQMLDLAAAQPEPAVVCPSYVPIFSQDVNRQSEINEMFTRIHQMPI